MGGIIEMVVVLAAAALMTIQGIREDIAHKRAALMATEGQNEAVISNALAGWVTDQYASLLNEFSTSSALSAPSVADLVTSGNLKQAHRNGPFWGGSYVITMQMVPSNCTASAGNCHVAYLMYPSRPLLKRGQQDVVGASQIAQAGGNQFGYSTIQNPGTVVGLNGAWNTPNPLGSVPAVIVATNGPDSDGNAVFIRRDGSLTWTGDQNVNHVSLHNVHDIDAEGTVSAADVAATGSVAASGAVAAGTTVTAGTTVNAGTTVGTGSVGWPRTACSQVNAMSGASDNSGLMLSCQNLSGVLQWMPIGGPKLWYGYTAILSGGGTFVPSPVCPAGGTPGIVVTGQSMFTDPTAAINYPTAGTGPWTVYITDGNGSVISGTAVASTFCTY
jgi:hypothetical protein